MTDRHYADPADLRRAIKDRLRSVVTSQPRLQLADLQRQLAYDRLLTRVFVADPDGWVLKGAVALLVRVGESARHSLDVDLYRPVSRLEEAESALRRAAAVDLDDHFQFALARARTIAEGQPVARVPVTAYLGTAVYARFRVDLSTGLLMTGAPEVVDGLSLARIHGLPSAPYRLYPIADHVADKVCALLEVHDRAGSQPQASTRYRDLADLIVIAHTQSVDAGGLRTALASESARRAIQLPPAFRVPDAPGWPAGYARVVREAVAITERDLGSALARQAGSSIRS